ncbi:MAG: cell division protein SepF [Candidatus Bathyarchaeia archaeon]
MPGLGSIFRRVKKVSKAEVEVKDVSGKTYLKALPLRDLSDLDSVKSEVKAGNIVILRITPLANKSIEDVKRAVNELCEFTSSLGGDIARLGEERVVVCPPNVRIWREKLPAPNEPIPTAA